MKLIEIFNSRTGKVVIPEYHRNEFPIFLKEMGYNTGAEIGVYRGEFTEQLCKAGLKMYAIDPWMGFSGQGRTQKQQDVQDDSFAYTTKLLSPYDCTIIRKTSMNALQEFDDSSLDFVYIDGNHDFPHVAEDIYEWAKKVKTGGVISGHDYYCTASYARNMIVQVSPVVDAFVKAYNVENYYIFGKDLSWMFLKTW